MRLRQSSSSSISSRQVSLATATTTSSSQLNSLLVKNRRQHPIVKMPPVIYPCKVEGWLYVHDREIPLGHSPKGQAPQVEWEPYFCVLNQLDQTFTSYRSEEMSIFPGTPTRPRTPNNVFGGDGVSPTEIVRVRLDGGPNSVKCLINNSKWGMNPVLEEEEGEPSTVMLGGIEKEAPKSGLSAAGAGDYSSSGSGSNHRNSSPASIHHDTSYDKACGSEQQQRRSSAPLTPLLGRDTPSRFANFFSKRSFKSNPLKRTKSVTKLERKKVPGMESEQSAVYPTRLRTSRSHESLLAWSTHSMNNFVNNGMMSTLDLTAGDVTIRPLHPSILGQEYGFQIITQSTGSGSKYYSCSSLPERDAWVNALQQAIRPHADEVRRLENSLKIWILEGKGLLGGSGSKQATKRYFCELYLDETLYARTSAKPRGEMLFWGEHFEFTQLPNCVQLITVVFFREGDKKRKKERNTCIGKVKIPVNTVNSRYLIEKWYPVLPDTPSQKEKENGSKDTKEGPSLRIKCKFQSVDILPLRCYKPFLQYVKDEYGPVSECLEGVLSVKAKEDLANAMVHVLHHEGLAKEFIAELALQEILRSGDEKLTFRGNSIATKAMEAFLKLTGSEYLHATLGSFIETFQGSEDLYDCEIDSMKLSQGSSLAKNQENLRRAVDAVWKQIVQSHAIFPIELRDCFAHCREALKSAGRDELSDHLISASIFLRFLCPAILSPSLFNITNEYPTEKSARNLTLVAKVLQTLANFTRFQGKENYMEFINDFVEREAPNMKIFLARISSPLEGESGKKAGLTRVDSEEDKVPQPLPGGFIDLGKYSSILSTLLSESVAKIAPKNERFKKLQDILETIHSWLKQPLNATNVTNFPFPHLASPPPNGPPPPAPMLGLPPPPLNMNHRAPTPILSPASSQHQYQIPINSTTPIYAVTNVIHNTANPNVKNISHVQLLNHNSGYQNGPVPLHLQIPHVNSGHIILSHNNSQRSGSQASSGYQSQSPVLEGEAKSKNNSPQMSSTEQPGIHVNGHNVVSGGQGRIPTPLSFSNPGFTNRKSGSQSVDDLSSIGVDGGPAGYKKRLTRSSSSSDCEYASSTMASTKAKVRATKPASKPHGKNTKVSSSAHNRLSRRSSAELLRKQHPYSSSTDEDSDSGHVNDKDMEPAPQLPPRRSHGSKIRYSVGPRPNPDGSHHGGEKSLEEVRLSTNENAHAHDSYGINPIQYELEMMELRRAMESLQVKLNRAEERLFGHDSPSHGNGNSRRESDISLHSQHSPALSVHNSESSRNSRAVEENSKEMEQLLQRFLSAEEEMKREQELLTALDRKQKLIEAQEQKISRLDAVNNQLLSALSQIRDSLQQQHVQQQQIKIQQQLQKQQQHLESLSHGLVIPTDCSGASGQNRNSSHLRATTNYLNNNFSCGPNNVNQVSVGLPDRPPHRLQPSPRYSLMNATNNNNQNNTTKVLITSDHSGSSGNVSPDSLDNGHHEAHDYCSSGSNRDSSTILGEQALKMLADLKSSSC